MKYCKKCGNQLPEESRFCSVCGTNQDNAKDLFRTEERHTPASGSLFKESSPESRETMSFSYNEKMVRTMILLIVLVLGIAVIAVIICSHEIDKLETYGYVTKINEKIKSYSSYRTGIILFTIAWEAWAIRNCMLRKKVYLRVCEDRIDGCRLTFLGTTDVHLEMKNVSHVSAVKAGMTERLFINAAGIVYGFDIENTDKANWLIQKLINRA